MFRIDNATSSNAPPVYPAAQTGQHFTTGNPATSTPATIVDPWWLDQIQEEISNAINGAGIALAKGTNNQLLAAIQAIAAGSVSVGSGATSGDVKATAAQSAPAGWVMCNGAGYDKTNPSYTALFNAIGYAYGGAGNLFNVPDARGRTIIGCDPSNATGRMTGQAGGVNAAAVGQTGGQQSHQLSVAELPNYNLPVNDPGHVHVLNDPTHTHGVADPTHSHTPYDPGHAHGYFDPGHTHQYVEPGTTSGNGSGNDPQPTTFVGNTTPAGIGITIQGSGTNVSINPAYTGIGIDGAYTGITLNGSYTGIGVNSGGSNAAHNIVQPGLVLNYVIKL